jgi:glyoxylase-like metal-dependent hydrolase (beta-lactamase superfamily II)
MAQQESTQQEWTEPGAYPVAEGVYRIPLPLPQDSLRAVNVYVIESDDRLVLIDGGWALQESRDQLATALRGLGHEIPDIGRFLVTHMHRDHYTQAVAVRRETGATVGLGIGEKPSLDRINSRAEQYEPAQVPLLRKAGAHDQAEALIRWHATQTRPEHIVDYEYPDEWLTDGMDVAVPGRRMRAVATPGHTQGHVVFTDEGAGGLLFAGDHVLPHITPSIGFEPVPGDLPLGDFLQSLAAVRALPDMRLLPAHGPVTGSVHQRVDELLVHHEHRLAECKTAAAAGLDTAAAVAAQLPWTRRKRTFASLDQFNQMLATMETMAHLDLLAARGELRRETVDGVHHYLV